MGAPFERRDALPSYDPDVLPAVREMYFRDPSVLGVDPLHLSGMLHDEGFLPYYPTLSEVGAAQDLLIEAEKLLGVA